jgi:hypothetical protein
MENKYYVIFEHRPDNNKNYDKLRKYLNKYGLIEGKYDEVHNNNLAFIWFRHINSYKENILNKYHGGIKSYSINKLLNIDEVCDKYKLYENMKKYFPNDYINSIPYTFRLTEDTIYENNGEIYIAKPVNEKKSGARMSSGMGILIYDSEKTLELAKNNLEIYDIIVSSKYIKNPLLFKNRKMHLRCHMFITLIDNICSGYLFDIYKIILGKNEYKQSDYQNSDIHDSHHRNSTNNYIFPKDFTSDNINLNINKDIIDKLYNDIREIGKKITIILKDSIKCQRNVKNGYHLIGFDVLIDDNLNCYLLECNRFCDVSDEYGEIFLNPFFDWFNDIILTQLFNVDKTIKDTIINTPLI